MVTFNSMLLNLYIFIKINKIDIYITNLNSFIPFSANGGG